ncbi:MAG: hypothetical protein P9L99_09605 [Candidatus Lernaella stagnicola]|nr:hypothetical protein [Candidatus Lernaella stagnicola]
MIFGINWIWIAVVLAVVVVILAIVTKRSDIIIMLVVVGLGLWVLSHVHVCGVPAGIPFAGFLL